MSPGRSLAVGSNALFSGHGSGSVSRRCVHRQARTECACFGGSSNVPLGFVSLTDNLMMIAMAIWLALAAVGNVPGGIHP